MIKTNKDELLIGLISDTHIPDRTSEIPLNVINDFKNKNVDYIFHMGDWSSIEIYNYFIETFGKNKVFGVLGNMDLDAKLKKFLPEQQEFELYGHKIFMTHGTGGPNIIIKRLNKNYNLFKYDLIIFGHTHHPVNEMWRDGKLYVNPGTTTPLDGKLTVERSYGFLKISQNNIEPKIIHM